MFDSFYQSRAWAHAQSYYGVTAETIDGVQILRYPLPLGYARYHAPRARVTPRVISALRTRKDALFLTIDHPADAQPLTAATTIPETSFPLATRILDLTLTEEQLLAQMKPKGRYNIRIAEKNSIIIREGTVSEFHALLLETTARDGFSGHSADYYRHFLTATSSRLFVAVHADLPVAALILTCHGDTATYYYGASSYHQRALMAPYLLQWYAIRLARTEGYHYYDFLGVAPESAPDTHHLSGVSRFKAQFGGTLVHYPSPQRITFRPLLATLYSTLRPLHQLLRRIRS